METLHIIKIGGNIIDDSMQLSVFLKDFATINDPKILIHGGGKLATELAKKIGITQSMVDGRRITDAETLNVTVMVYAGLINKTIVAKLQAEKCNAIGYCGADGNLIKSKKRENAEIDFGFVGDILENGVDAKQFEQLLKMNNVPIISPITHDGRGNLLNTNADTMASKIASALTGSYNVVLTYCFEKNGVLSEIDNHDSYIPVLNKENYMNLKRNGIISKGMIPKLDNAFDALESGVKQVSVCHAKNISTNLSHFIGTKLMN